MKADNYNTKVNIGKIVPISTVDWYGRSACTIFFNGCNFRCPYCQNHKLLDCKKWIDIEKVQKNILDAKRFISAVVFSGGEPTLQSEALVRLARFIKSQGLLVGVQTNGSFPDVLRYLVRKKLVDKIFLDVKADPSLPMKYSSITGCAYIAAGRVIESLDIPYATIEVRTTIFRSINNSQDVAKYLIDNGHNHIYVIQQGVPWNAPDNKIRKEDILTREEIMAIARNITFLKGIKIRTRDAGEEDIHEAQD